MSHVVRFLLRVYVSAFASFSGDPGRARQELALLTGSIEYTHQRLRAAGRGRVHATLLTCWLHLGELQPLALVSTLRAIGARPGDARGRSTALRVLALASALVAAGLIWDMLVAGWLLAMCVWAGAGWQLLRLTLRRHDPWLPAIGVVAVLWPLVGVRLGILEVSYSVVFLVALLVAGRGLGRFPVHSVSWPAGIALCLMPLAYAALWAAGGAVIDSLTTASRSELHAGMSWGQWFSLVINLQLVAYWGLVALGLSVADAQTEGAATPGS